ncbi:hypothetical protein HRW08_39260 [Streptomyces lunaelactis]|nr:hypothetical protein [Streptomyces lunaelactis]
MGAGQAGGAAGPFCAGCWACGRADWSAVCGDTGHCGADGGAAGWKAGGSGGSPAPCAAAGAGDQG